MHGCIVSDACHCFSVRHKDDPVDVLLMALEHPRRAPVERPTTDCAIPGCRGERGAVRRYRECYNRPLVSFENSVRLLFPRRPDGDAGILAGGHGAAVSRDRDRIHRALMKAHHLLGGIAPKRPADRRCVEAARKRGAAVGRDRKRAYRTAMPAQLRSGRCKTERRPDQDGARDQRGQNKTHRGRSVGLI
jgi:hypothetical protein